MMLSTGLLALSAVLPLTTASTVRNWHAQPTNAAAPRNAVTYQDAVPPLMQELSNPQDRPLVRWGGDGRPERHTYRRGGSSLYSDMHQHKQRRGRDYGRDGRYDWWDNDSYRYGGYGGYGTAPHTYRHRPVQGSSRETWYTQDPYTEGMEVNLQTEGRPLNADVEVWQGPSNTRSRLKVYSEDGYMRPFRATMDTPRTLGGSAVSVRNAGPMEFPMAAGVSSYSTRNNGYGSSSSTTTMPSRRRRRSSTRERRYYDAGEFTEGGTTIQGGSLQTFQCDPSIGSARVTLHTDGMPLQAVIELWQGPGAARQIAEIDTEDGRARPFSAVIDTPSFGGAYGSVIAIRNTGPLAFPLKATVTPLSQANWY